MTAFILSIRCSEDEPGECNMLAQINTGVFLSGEFMKDYREEMSFSLFASDPILNFIKPLQSCGERVVLTVSCGRPLLAI